MHSFGNLDILSFFSISRLNLISHVNKLDSKRNVTQVCNDDPQGR